MVTSPIIQPVLYYTCHTGNQENGGKTCFDCTRLWALSNRNETKNPICVSRSAEHWMLCFYHHTSFKLVVLCNHWTGLSRLYVALGPRLPGKKNNSMQTLAENGKWNVSTPLSSCLISLSGFQRCKAVIKGPHALLWWDPTHIHCYKLPTCLFLNSLPAIS